MVTLTVQRREIEVSATLTSDASISTFVASVGGNLIRGSTGQFVRINKQLWIDGAAPHYQNDIVVIDIEYLLINEAAVLTAYDALVVSEPNTTTNVWALTFGR